MEAFTPEMWPVIWENIAYGMARRDKLMSEKMKRDVDDFIFNMFKMSKKGTKGVDLSFGFRPKKKFPKKKKGED